MTDDGLKLIYSQYPHLSKELYPLIVARKETIDNPVNQITSNETTFNLIHKKMNLVLNNPIHQVIDKEEIIVFPKGTLLKQTQEVKHLQIRMHYSGVQQG
jgi:hypothetical protein